MVRWAAAHPTLFCLNTALLLGGWAVALPAQVYEVEAGAHGLLLKADLAGRPQTLLQGLRYRANDEQGCVFETQGATLDENGLLTFTLAGPGAQDASVTAQLTRLRHGFSLAWTLRYSGPERKWNGWTSGFQFDFAQEITGVRTQPVIRWVKPTGAQPWEVAGDTPYPDTEGQLRAVFFGETALVMVCSEYDPDWIYGNNRDRARFARFALPPETPGERMVQMTFLVAPAAELEPADLAAEAAGRPLALTIRRLKSGDFSYPVGLKSGDFSYPVGLKSGDFSYSAPGEPVAFECRVSNVTDREQTATLSLEAWSYQGERLLADTEELTLPASSRRTLTRRLQPQLRGVIFLAARLAWAGGETIHRATLGVLPERKAAGTRPDSPFGLAAVIANPEAYPDQFDLPTVLRLVERIGVRWIRGGWFPLQAEFTEAEEQRVRERVELLRRHGILPHVQLGSEVPKPEGLEGFQQRLAASLERFRWVSPYVEIGNELNFSTKATDYVDRMLRPIHEVMQRVFPEGQVMSMGLGGVSKDWLDEFVAAGGLDLIDVLSVHPGSFPRAPEFWAGWRGWVFRPQMLDATKAAREHGHKAVWITEAYAPTPPGRSGLDLRTSADYLVRTYVCALALGVKVIEWYQFQDGTWFGQRPRPDDVEYNFGLVYTDLTPKPAYVAYGAMTEQLEGAVYQGRLDLGAEDLYGVRFLKDGRPLDVLWSYRERHETDLPWWPPEQFEEDSRQPGEPWEERWKAPVTVELPAVGPVTVTDLMGNPREVQPTGGQVKLSLTGSPIYVRGLGGWPTRPRLWEDVE